MKFGLHEEMSPVEKQDLETMCEQKECATSPENKGNLHCMELAIDDPMFEVSYIKLFGAHLYAIDIHQKPPLKEGIRNMDFEIVYPLYSVLTDIIEAAKTPKTSEIKIKVNSRDHFEAVYTDEFPVDQWSYNRMDDIMEGLADQLTMKQNLNGGLLIQLTFNE